MSDRPEPHEMVLLDRGPVFLYVVRPEGTVSSNVAIFIDIFAIQHSEEAGRCATRTTPWRWIWLDTSKAMIPNSGKANYDWRTNADSYSCVQAGSLRQ